MFEPNFHYTDDIVRNLTAIADARATVLSARLIPKWEAVLRRDAILKSAHASTAIEGNPLSYDEVSELQAGRDIMVQRKDKLEVLNYLEALDKVPDFAGRSPFKTEDLLELHGLATKGTLDDSQDEGAFRREQVVIRAGRRVVFMPPETKDVPRLIGEFIGWLNSKKANKLDPVVEAGLAHYELVRIHPFIDGNGRTARLTASVVLYARGFDIKRFFTLDDYYDRDRRAYYDALDSVNQRTLDLTKWLEYFTTGMAVSIKAVKDRVIGLSRDIKALKERGQIALTERQMKIVERIIVDDRITVGEVAAEFNVSRQAALKEMAKLVDLGVVVLRGEGRGAHYVLV